MNEINKFYKSLVQEVVSRQIANEEGDNQEQTFTRYCLELLSEAGETENCDVAFLERGLGTKNQLKINGYAISDNDETVDLFISLYEGSVEPITIHKEEIETAAKRLTNFFRNAIYSDFGNEIEESSSIFEFVNTLGNHKELRDSLIRVNAFILTNGTYKGEIPNQVEISGYKIFFRIFDINNLYQISEDAHAPITINLEEGGWQIPCLHAPSCNDDYDVYVAILPGDFLYYLYDIYGGRLLEQNVRSFLQFTGKINQGIRETIRNAPHMFLAYNNGIAATADSIEVDSNNYIKTISNFQIVNGGQTTASIFHTKKKDKADLSNIYVQVKLSIVKKKDDYANIVSAISKYANTQNKVNNADFSANNPILVELEKVSRYVMTPITPERSMQTYWFFERARSQYKNIRQKEGFTMSRQKAFDLKYPKNQMFTKVELAKYINCFEEVYEGNKLVIAPHIVVRGSEKNYAQFVARNLPSNPKIVTNVYFEDTIAKAILFKTTDRLYGTKRTGNNIGELKSVVVPYTIGLLNYLTSGRIDLYRIWKNQKVSDALSKQLYSLMLQVNPFIMKISPSNNYLEWAKKEECWLAVRNNKDWKYDLNSIKDDLIDPKHPVDRKKTINNTTDDTFEHDWKIIRSIPYKLWLKFAEWGADSGVLSLNQQSKAREIANDLKHNHKLSSLSVSRGMSIFNKVCEENYELLEEADRMREEEQKETTQYRKQHFRDKIETTGLLANSLKEDNIKKDYLASPSTVSDIKYDEEGKIPAAMQEGIPVVHKESAPIDSKILERAFDKKVTSYKFLWMLAILTLTKERGILAISFKDLTIRMASFAWPLLFDDDIDFGSLDFMKKYLTDVMRKTPLVPSATQKVVESYMRQYYDIQGISTILAPLMKNVPYRFLSPWIKFTTIEEVVAKSNAKDYNGLYAIQKDGILLDEDWWEYIETNYEKIYTFTLNSFVDYLNQYNNPMKLIKLKMR